MPAENTNPGNFANRPTEEVKHIASMGGKAGHGGNHTHEDKLSEKDLASQGRRADGTFLPGSAAASEAGHNGGLHSHDNDRKDVDRTNEHPGRNPDGTFTKGSVEAKEAGSKGGHAHVAAA